MMLDLTTLWIVGCFFLTGGVAITGYLVSNIMKNSSAHKASMSARILVVEEDVNELRVHVAENYIGAKRFEKFEDAITTSIANLSSKFDSIIFSFKNNGKN